MVYTTYALTFLHVCICLFLIAVVLLQSGKAADLAGAFGGMGSQTAFGPRGAATVLSRATSISAILFMVTSLSLSILATRRGRTPNSVLDKSSSKPVETKAPETLPLAPAQKTIPVTPPPAAPQPKQ
jgi:preprotein translocase subunit SecG